jgi:hypothetical protein
MNHKLDSPLNHYWITLLKSFCFLAVGLSISAFLLFYGVKLMNENNPYRAVIHINMLFSIYNFKEIDRQPLPYLITMVFISSIIGAIWTTFVAPKYTRHVKVQVLAVPWISLIVTSPIWGIIWSINLRNPQFFIEHYSNDPTAVMLLFYRTDAISGLNLGWLSALQSFPINILSYITFCFLLLASSKLFSRNTKPKSDSVLPD